MAQINYLSSGKNTGLTNSAAAAYMKLMDKQPSKRQGTAMWFPDKDADLLRAVAAAEDRTLQQVMLRALRAYAARSRDYQSVARVSA